MTPELIKQWAIQSGFTGQECLSWWTDLSEFAALVAAHQRELDSKDAERYRFIEESRSGTIRLDGDQGNPKDFRYAAPTYIHWTAPEIPLSTAIDRMCAAAIRGTTPEDKKPPTP